MSEKAGDDRFRDIPALANPSTPALRRLRARLEGRTLSRPRKDAAPASQAKPSTGASKPAEAATASAKKSNTSAPDASGETRTEEAKPFKLRLTKPHPLIRKTQEMEQRRKRDEWAYLSRDPWPGVASSVSKGRKRVALAVMDRLFKALEAEELTVDLRDGPPRHGVYAIDGQDKIPLDITEEHCEVPHEPTQQELKRKERDPYYRIPKRDVVPTGQLILSPGGRVDLSSQEALDVVLAKAVAEVKQQLDEARARREAEAQRREEEWRRQEEQRAEKARVEALHQAAKDLHQYRLLMDYIEEVRRFGRVPDDQRKEGQSLEEWIRWAEWKARCIHPLG